MNVVESFWKASPDAVLQHQQAMPAADPVEQKRRPDSRLAYPGHQPQSRERGGTGVPAYRVHRAKGLGYVRLNKRMIYLGAANTPESFERYRRVLGEWLATGRAPKRKSESTAALTVNEVVEEYLRWARQYYLDADGIASAGLAPVEAAAKTLKALYGTTVAVEFGPIAFKAIRLAMIEEGLCRNVINQRASCIKRIFRWAVGEERLPASVLQALSAVEPLRVGRSAARESRAVRPVPDEHVHAVLPFLPLTLQAMVRLQRLTGMRSGELCVLRTCDVDMSKEVWVYRPRSHKTAYRGHNRAVPIGPKGQAVLKPFLRADTPHAYVFSPQRALAERRGCANRAAAKSADERKAAVVSVPSRDSSNRYKPRSYNRALHYAMKRAEAAGNLAKSQFWHPHQLRHRHATEIRQSRGLEAARVLLGHRTLSQTLEYAEADAGVASALAKDLG
jgi:integrase